MNKKANLKKFFMPVLILLLLITLVPLAASCKKEAIFGNLTISESVKKDTSEPVNPKNEFDLFTKEIAAAINIQNVKGIDNYRFLWKNSKTGEVISDINGKYQEGEARYGSGWFASTASVKKGFDVIALPGDYTVEFYHNGELKSSANFKIKEPEAKILSVSLANEINDKMEPVKTTQEFNSGSAIYACVQINYIIPGDILLAKWYDESGAVILETPMELKDSFYKTSWVSFTLEGIENKPIPEGKHKVEIYLNDVKYNEFNFTIKAPVVQTNSDITFDKGNIFTEAEGKYYFTIGYPDNCEYTWQEDQNSMSVTFTPLNKNDGYSTIMMAGLEDSLPSTLKIKEGYDVFADELAKQAALGTEGMTQIGD
ncbi:MAG: hypothetical protein ACYC3T_08875, partial [Candidatus Humimicrobiaceae bacterium]